MTMAVPQFSPAMMYGTAWKEDHTKQLTLMAIKAGCRAIDTANQRKHYFEVGVGEALIEAYANGWVQRADMFLQTKFTYLRGQDHRLPYDPSRPFGTQVKQSFKSSQEHLGTDVIDSYVLHGPSTGYGLTDADREVWTAMESLHGAGSVRFLGVSNVTLSQLKLFYDFAAIKPSFVQNRCYASTKWDKDIRDFCSKHAIKYQGFSLLTANIDYLSRQQIKELARKYDCTIAQLVFRFAQQVNMLPLTGTSNAEHLATDLMCESIQLTDDDLTVIEAGRSAI